MLGIPEGIVMNWEEGLRVALTEQTPATGMDRLMTRVLYYLAEIEELWSSQASATKPAGASPVRKESQDSNLSPDGRSSRHGSGDDSRSVKNDSRAKEAMEVRLSGCRRLRAMWYRLALTGCQLGMVPPDVLAKVLEDCGGFCSMSGRGRKRGESSVHVQSFAPSPQSRQTKHEEMPSAPRHGAEEVKKADRHALEEFWQNEAQGAAKSRL